MVEPDRVLSATATLDLVGRTFIPESGMKKQLLSHQIRAEGYSMRVTESDSAVRFARLLWRLQTIESRLTRSNAKITIQRVIR